MTGITVPRSMEVTTDVALAAAGDEHAFARLIERHSGAMTRVAFVTSGDWETAHEGVQVAWAIAWRKLPSLRERDRVEPWLVAIAANETRTLLRRARRRAAVESRRCRSPSGGTTPPSPSTSSTCATRSPASAPTTAP